MILNFHLKIKLQVAEAHEVAQKYFRPVSRQYDEQEHEEPWDLINYMWEHQGQGLADRDWEPDGALMVEELCWGDAGLYLASPGLGLGGAAVFAAGTKEQWGRFLARFNEGKPKWGAMAMTEPGCGSDTAAITATATRDGDYWVLNGEKIFVTMGHRALDLSDGIIVVWATVDKSAGRAGMKSFVVEAGTPGMKVEKLEKKLGIKASDTATVVFENCRIPFDQHPGQGRGKDQDRGLQRRHGDLRPDTPDGGRPGAGRLQGSPGDAARTSLISRASRYATTLPAASRQPLSVTSWRWRPTTGRPT